MIELNIIVGKDTLGKTGALSSRKLRERAFAAMVASVLKIAKDAVAVPPMPYKTGTLRRSITFAVKGSWPVIVGVVGTNVKYARIQEYGGRSGKNGKTEIKGKYFLTKATESNRQYVRQQFRKRMLGG